MPIRFKEIEVNDMTTYEKILEDVLAIKIERGKMYRVEPKDVVPIEVLEAVALLKAYRGYEGISIEKKIDEYRDLINYSAFIIERLENKRNNQMITPALHMCSSTCLTVSHPVCFGQYDAKRPLCESGLCEVHDYCKRAKDAIEETDNGK